MSLLLYIDVESTGLNPKTAGLTQVSAIIVRDGEEVSRINLHINPYTYNRDITVSKKALNITNKTVSELKTYTDSTVAMIKFTKWLNCYRDLGEYYTVIAYRATFDVGMLEAWFKDIFKDSKRFYDYVEYKILDVLQLVLFMDLYGLLYEIKNHKLITICEYYGIELDAHDSMNDIIATRQLHKKLIRELRLPPRAITKI